MTLRFMLLRYLTEIDDLSDEAGSGGGSGRFATV
jgi:hypothetical protein